MIITFLLFLATFRSSIALSAVFLFLIFTFMALAIGEFMESGKCHFISDPDAYLYFFSHRTQGWRHPGLHHCDDRVLHGIGRLVQPRCELLYPACRRPAQASHRLAVFLHLLLFSVVCILGCLFCYLCCIYAARFCTALSGHANLAWLKREIGHVMDPMMQRVTG